MAMLTITVSLQGMYSSNRIRLDIDDPYVCERFIKPLVLTDDPLFTMMGDTLVGSTSHTEGLRLRQHLAEDISKGITDALLEQMSKNDMMNGYGKNELL